ncbi:Glycosyltransferase involved in cell wall bisynthesis [Paenibacillus sp. 1_12]|uniref:glycosyltransferase n=1 Tax=Paenibacillus sp. 1_12 TaxID=1566278 RepID=UPI0008E9A40D|nr:glycosyltransferase [Paenibacillus sp. 1_12]SFL16012.1 Glycosyltransferase involved in cell wall bisynthesis [Paenibacillus sp. 1_12]
MKKELLFVIPSLTSGGGERSLVSLLSKIDYDLYNVDLFLLTHDGLFMDLLPSEVNLIPLSEEYKLFTLPIVHSMRKLLIQGKPSLAYNRIMFSMKNRYSDNLSKREQYNWKFISKSLDRLPKKYDVAVGFLEKTSIYFCVEKVDADKKMGWVHTDYDKLGMDTNIDNEYFSQLDHIITVSEECANILIRSFPEQKEKIAVIYNIVSPTMIKKMANETNHDLYLKKEDEVIILSIGRLHNHKGFEMAVEACKKVIDRGYKIKWNIIGDGEERDKLTQLIKANELQNTFILLGLKTNPYPYIKQADIYAQTSRVEGKSIAIDEAKILNKPILVTNFSTASDQINDNVDGLIVEMDSDAIANGIEKLIVEKSLREMFIKNLAGLQLGTEQEIDKLYDLIK